MEACDVFFRGLQDAPQPRSGADAALSVLPASRRSHACDSESDLTAGAEDVDAATLMRLLAKYGEKPTVSTKAMALTWSEFVREYSSAGLSQKDLVELFQRQRKGRSSVAPYPPPAPPPPTVRTDSERSDHAEKTIETAKAERNVACAAKAFGHGVGPPPPPSGVHETPAFFRSSIQHYRLLTPVTGASGEEYHPTDLNAFAMMKIRAFKETEGGWLKDASRVKDFNGLDISFEEQFTHFKSRMRITTDRLRGGSDVFMEWVSRVGYQRFVSAWRFAARGSPLSFEEDRAACYEPPKLKEFTIPKPKVPAVNTSSHSRAKQLFARYPPSTESLPRVTMPFSPSSSSLLHRQRTQKARSSAVHPAHAVYPPPTTSLPWISVDFAVEPHSSAPISQLTLSDPATRRPRSPDVVAIDPKKMLLPLRCDQDAEIFINGAGDCLGDAIAAGKTLASSLCRIKDRHRDISRTNNPSTPRDPPPLDSRNVQVCMVPNNAKTEDSAIQESESDLSTNQTNSPPESSYKVHPSDEMIKIVTQPQGGNTSEKKHVRGVYDDGREVAIRVLDTISKGVKVKIETRVDMLAKATVHQSVCRIFGSVSLNQGKNIGLLLDSREGSETVSSMLHHGKLKTQPVEVKLRLLIQIVEAVKSIHAHGVAHGDLRPQDIAVKPDYSQVKVTKVGHTRLKSLVSAATHSSVVGSFPDCFLVGCTPAYAAPEVLRGDVSQQDDAGWIRSDVYSLGVIVAEVLLGKLPWEDEIPMFVWNSVVLKAKRPFFLGELRLQGKPSRALETLVCRAWHQDPELRVSASDLAQGLRALLATASGSSLDS